MTGPAPAFASLSLDKSFLETLDQLGWKSMTPVQAEALPPALGGKDLVVQAATGSGKTAVFALSLLTRLNLRFFGAQALVLCPTRELADQVAIEVRKLGRGLGNLKVVTLCGGVPLRGQADSLSHGAHIVVGTPGRIRDHLSRKTLVLDGLRTLVLDEADRMLDMGFVDDMVAVSQACPAARQTLLFSATYPASIQAVAGPFLVNPLVVKVRSEAAVPKIDQRFYEVADDLKSGALASLLAQFKPETTLVFVNTKAQAREVSGALGGLGISVRELSGDLEQRDRDEVMILFSSRCLSVLVATDVASRGLDISALDAVVNYDVTPDPEVHVHRVGRTGRAGEGGLALTLVSPREKALVKRIEEYQGTGPTVWDTFESRTPDQVEYPVAPRAMVKFLDGKKDKLRPGDILGALTASAGFHRDQIGAIKVTEWGTWVAVDRDAVDEVLAALGRTPVKGKVRRAVKVGGLA